ncbi:MULTISPECIES: 3'-5' exonuclease KapD [Bacillaceae]|uniref:3'-5' exonuclease KapD n=1 Tax=Bacillaceae TaxID=186817 RepID=UPI001C587345|nr:3'-5' exonuclease KapD [Rossellomorea sp. YZS02]MBW3111115.1 3'-5' exonuclease KapD [Bacillus sp. MCCB 382]MDX8346195.1 3'-5' exonuclease KapD [Rossellomorea sp. YZS02]
MAKAEQLVFIDFEFSMPERNRVPKGFFPEIIEAGVVVVESGKVSDTFSSYVRPTAFPKLTNRCKRFLSISQNEVDSGISFQCLIDYFNGLNAAGVAKVVTWGNMDMKVLRDNCVQSGLPFPFQAQFVDLSMEYKRFFGDQNQTGLWKAVQEYGREGVGKHHKALDDALTTQHIYNLVEKDKKYLDKAEPTTIGDRIDLSKFYNQLA